MVDEPTGSLWSHILGEAMDGPLKGTRLEIVPAVVTTWVAWKDNYPGTTVLALSRSARQFDVEFQKRPQTFVLGIRLGRKAYAWPFDFLQKEVIVNDAPFGRPMVVFHDLKSTEAQAFHREVDGKVVTFTASLNGQATDRETGSIWDPHTGKCLTGSMKGRALRPTTAIISFRKAWNDFHPDSGYYVGADSN